MSAPAKLPACPVCGHKDVPVQLRANGYKRWCASLTHSIEVYGRTLKEADARWRRLARGGAK